MNLYDVLAGQGTTHVERLFSQRFAGGRKTQTLTGVPPLTFKANGKPLISWSMLGNGQQTGTPTPDAPITPEFVGTLYGADWTIPLTCAGQTVPVYLAQVSTVRRIKKLVFDGTETWNVNSNAAAPNNIAYMTLGNALTGIAPFCTHYDGTDKSTWASIPLNNITVSIVSGSYARCAINIGETTLADFKSYLAAQYANGTPVTVWYVLATPETGIVNEPLAKIGDYADELHSEDAGVTIPTVRGANTLTVDTDLPPSEMTITFKG